MTKIKPLPGFVLVEPVEDDTTSAGGVYLPDSSKDKPSKGTIISVGDYTKDWQEQWRFDNLEELFLTIKRGSVVIYKKWTNQEVQDEGKTYLLVPFSDLLAIIE